ncbi:Type I restriction-modification system specificity subunit S [Lactiplantibacillus plantarum]|uniref:restriction endonuclease subunit S n=1 Tax=Lactiplantibacillus plantarum TaxID=1590 RepID=UPI0007C1216F|nr:restriction endonuclease subunit S [Lactiplantibacillus plantarum]KZT97218.1 Type I restriction-modification system specificity subunit S [Lactiplantibacillus plantarum]
MKNENLVPKVRFKGFSDPWEQRKLGELFNERKEKSSQGELLSVTINSGIVKFDTLDRKNNSSADKSNYRVVRYGDIAYNSMRMWQGASGLSMYNGIVSPAYTVITPRTNTDAGFMAVNFKRKSMIQVFQRNSQGLTSDTWNLKFPVLKNIRISIPKITEQQIITELFTVINNLIAANEDKLEQLKTLKKLMMQKIFSQEWRFKGFTDPWEQRKLSSVVTPVKSYSITRDNERKSTNTEYIHYGDIHKFTNTIIDDHVTLPNIADGDYIPLNEGDLVLADASEDYVEIAKPLVLFKTDGRNIVSGLHTIALHPHDVESLFLYNVFNSQNFRRYGYKVGTGLKVFGVSSKNILKYSFNSPSMYEQKKIDSILLKLTDLIAANEDKLNQLKKLKKYLMQNMFV